MPKAVKTTTTSDLVAGTSRRRLADAAALLAVFGSAGPFAGSAEAVARVDADKMATIENYAEADFEPWPPGTINVIGDRARWIDRTGEDYLGIAIAAAVMERTREQLSAFQDEETANTAIEMTACLYDMAERYKGLADMLTAAHVRMVAGVARYCIATGEA